MLACLGVLGLVALSTAQRMKEIGIRKALGASAVGIAALISGEYVRLVFVALVVAAPVAYYAMRTWLAAFAYRITPGPGVFVLAGLVALVVTLAVIGFQVLRVARSSPVEVLNYE